MLSNDCLDQNLSKSIRLETVMDMEAKVYAICLAAALRLVATWINCLGLARTVRPLRWRRQPKYA